MTTAHRSLIAVVTIIGVGIAYWLISPLFITRRVSEVLPSPSTGAAAPPDTAPVVSAPAVIAPAEMMPAAPVPPPAPQGPRELARGTFQGLAGHRAQGTARVIEAEGKRYVRFESDFHVTNGPDLFVYLGREGAYDPNTRLSALKGNEGSQNYELPIGTDLATYDAVWVWCRAFSVPFGRATFTFPS